MKRCVDILLSLIGLIIAAPILLPVMLLVWLQDRHSPFYIAPRVGLGEAIFNMVKLRSMIINADKSGVDSTSADDQRITKVGQFIRRYKLDELTQLWNVLAGHMSLVGPRPNVQRETDLYTDEEKVLLTVKPGITDFSSIVFSDEGDILEGKDDPDIAYHQLIRPGKSLLGLFYVRNNNLIVDFVLMALTVLAILSRQKALSIISVLLRRLGADDRLVEVAERKNELLPAPPPGANNIVVSRDGSVS